MRNPFALHAEALIIWITPASVKRIIPRQVFLKQRLLADADNLEEKRIRFLRMNVFQEGRNYAQTQRLSDPKAAAQ